MIAFALAAAMAAAYVDWRYLGWLSERPPHGVRMAAPLAAARRHPRAGRFLLACLPAASLAVTVWLSGEGTWRGLFSGCIACAAAIVMARPWSPRSAWGTDPFARVAITAGHLGSVAFAASVAVDADRRPWVSSLVLAAALAYSGEALARARAGAGRPAAARWLWVIHVGGVMALAGVASAGADPGWQLGFVLLAPVAGLRWVVKRADVLAHVSWCDGLPDQNWMHDDDGRTPDRELRWRRDVTSWMPVLDTAFPQLVCVALLAMTLPFV